MKQHVIIVAGGSGTRMKSDVPKQFMRILGKPIITRTIEKFFTYNPEINMVIVVHADYQALLIETLKESTIDVGKIKICLGGATRFDSVKNGLNCLENETGIVGIHDAARPFVSIATITNCYQTAAKLGNATPCLSIHESLREMNTSGSHIVNRDAFKIIQTPQCFELSVIRKAFDQTYRLAFTDDASVLETAGEKINLVEGNVENIKITTPSDLIIAKAFCDDGR